MVRTAGHQRLPGDLPRPSGRVHAAHGVGRRRLEAETASDELQRFHPAMAGEAFHELGEIRLRMGDLEGAEEAFGQAQALGSESQPGKALLLLARGRTDAAAASIRGSLEEITWRKLARARLLPAQADIAKSLGDLPTAGAAAAELEEIAEEFGTAAIRASAAYASGIVALLRGDPSEAVTRARDARRLWREIDAPYEAAISTVLLAEARTAMVSPRPPRSKLEAARAAFERLGATPEMARMDALAGAPRPTRFAGGAHVHVHRHRGLHRLGRGDRGRGVARPPSLARRSAAPLLRHERRRGGPSHRRRLLRGVLGRPLGARMRRGDPARTLADHRRDHGFAPGVRVASTRPRRRGRGDYEGAGVHAAARIAALAQGGEVLASVETVEGISNVPTGEPREEMLKGLAKPVHRRGDWRSWP